jgi:histidinol-phosphate/aromatic aminotransferase/cobyric acid decarboxylase-like protein
MRSVARERVHGGLHDDELRALRLDAERVLDFSVNTNPYGPCPAVAEAIKAVRFDRYPDPRATRVRAALASALDLTADEVVLGAGAADLLWTAARALLPPGSRALVVEPTFCEFRAAALAAGAQVDAWSAEERDGFRIDIDAVARAVWRCRPAALYLCVPNTPTGASVPASEIAAMARALPEVTLVLDQSFLSLGDRFADAAVAMPGNVVRIRSLTKDHAIPGVRVGYALAHPDLALRMTAQQPAWGTSAHAQAAALAALRAQEFVAESRTKLAIDRARTSAELAALGLAPLPSTAPFLMVRVPRASELRDRLLARHQIAVRACDSFGLPDFMRLAARPAFDSARLCAALSRELSC